MRKALSAVLAVLGVCLIVLAVLLPTVIVPRSKKTPLNLDITVVSTGTAKVLNPQTGQAAEQPVKATRTVRTDKGASDSTNTVVDVNLCVVVDVNGPPPCPAAGDPRLLAHTTDRVATNRKNAEAVNEAKYGESINGNTAARHSGLAYKWPIDASKKTYTFFDVNLGKAFPAKYVRTEKLKGLTVYVYECKTGPQPFKIQGQIPGTYDDTRTVWVEPRTGVIVKGTEHQVQTLAAGPVAVDLMLSFDDASQANQADYAKDKIAQLNLAGRYLPIGFAVLGVLALVAAGLLMRRPARSRPDPEASAGAPEAGER